MSAPPLRLGIVTAGGATLAFVAFVLRQYAWRPTFGALFLVIGWLSLVACAFALGRAVGGRSASSPPAADYAARVEAELARRLAAPPGGDGARCACGTANDADAVFCKRCGGRLREVAP